MQLEINREVHKSPERTKERKRLEKHSLASQIPAKLTKNDYQPPILSSLSLQIQVRLPKLLKAEDLTLNAAALEMPTLCSIWEIFLGYGFEQIVAFSSGKRGGGVLI